MTITTPEAIAGSADRVLAILTPEGLTVKEIAEALGIGRETARRTVLRMVERGDAREVDGKPRRYAQMEDVAPADDSDDPTSVLNETPSPSPAQLEGNASETDRARMLASRRREAGIDPRPAEIAAAVMRTIEGALTGAGIPRAGHATIVSTLDALGIDRDGEITPDQAKRLKSRVEGRAKVGLTGKAAVTWIVTGEDGATQTKKAQLERQMGREASSAGAKRSASSPRNANVDPADQSAAALATEAAGAKGKPLSQRVAPKEIAKAREVVVQMLADAFEAGRFPNARVRGDLTLIPAALGFTSERAMREYVDGRTTVLKDDAKAGVKALTKGIASHQVWARKAAAAAFGIYLAAQQETR